MPRKKKSRTRTRYVTKKAYKRRRSGSSFGKGGILAAMLYGAVRPVVANWLSPISTKLPFGQFADEGALLLANYVAGKYIGRGMPIIRNMTKVGSYIEWASIGSGIAGGIMTRQSNGGLF